MLENIRDRTDIRIRPDTDGFITERTDIISLINKNFLYPGRNIYPVLP